MSPAQTLRPGDAVLVVDVQIDFCPGGSLPINGGEAVVPVLNRWLGAALDKEIPVYASRDWHPVGHVSFAERGGEWPPHCLQDTEGAAFHPDLDLPADVVKITKGVRFDKDQYSALDDTGLAERLREDGVKRLWVGGLAQDVCVEASVLAACDSGFEVHVISDATRPITAEGGEQAKRRMEAAGASFDTTD
jgi:nicotinamidase/pyrazinamidase